MSTQEDILIMTSTIAPEPGTFLLSRSDPEMRLGDYISAFDFQLKLIEQGDIHRILYADNSGYPLDRLKAIAESRRLLDRVEFLSFKSPPVNDVSRFYLEVDLLEYAIKHSAILKGHENSRLWKITGRYIVQNIAEIMANAPRQVDFFANFRNYPYRTVDFYLVSFTLRFFKQIILDNRVQFRNIESGETVLRNIIERGAADHLLMRKRITPTPRLQGIRGYDSGVYGGPKDRMKYLLRSSANKILPGLWI